MRFHVGAQDGVDTGLVSTLAAEPSQQVGIEAHGDDFFRCGQDDLAVFQNCASVARASESAPMPLRIWAGVLRPRRLQSVAPSRFVLRLFVIVVLVVVPLALIRSTPRCSASFPPQPHSRTKEIPPSPADTRKRWENTKQNRARPLTRRLLPSSDHFGQPSCRGTSRAPHSLLRHASKLRCADHP